MLKLAIRCDVWFISPYAYYVTRVHSQVDTTVAIFRDQSVGLRNACYHLQRE